MIYDPKSAAGMVECRMPLFQFFASCHIAKQHKLPVIQLKSTCSCTVLIKCDASKSIPNDLT